MMAAGVEMQQHHTEPTLLRVREDNLCTISPGKEDEEFADTLRLAAALTSPVALLRAVRFIAIVIYLTESEFDSSELLVHPFSQTAEDKDELELNNEENDSTMDVDTAQHGAAEVPSLVNITLDRSIVQRTFREGTHDGTT
eukprot:jgi/Tetstr1/427524/TSEL_017650.t1